VKTMKSKPLVWVLYIVLALSLVSVAAASAQGSEAKLIIINYVGADMTFTLDGTVYTVPGTGTVPGGGQLTLTLAPGRHTYSGQVPGADGSNGEVDLTAGQTQTLGARLEQAGAVISPAGVVLQKPREVLVFFAASLTPPAPTVTPQPVPLQPLPAGQGALVFVNYIGEDLIVNIHNVQYTVPADSRLQINLPPGEINYTASTSRSSLNGSVQVTAGAYTGLGFTREIPPKPDYDVGQPAPTPVPLKMSVFPVPLKGEPVSQATSTPPVAASPTVASLAVSAPAGQGELTVTNYIGETLTFTINNQAYPVAGNGGSLTLDLAPGEYTFTASTPGAAANNSLYITAGAVTRVSVALDVQSGQIEIYIE
jgi:hypothetical protein